MKYSQTWVSVYLWITATCLQRPRVVVMHQFNFTIFWYSRCLILPSLSFIFLLSLALTHSLFTHLLSFTPSPSLSLSLALSLSFFLSFFLRRDHIHQFFREPSVYQKCIQSQLSWEHSSFLLFFRLFFDFGQKNYLDGFSDLSLPLFFI